MQGRLENDLKTEKNIATILQQLPDYVTSYYYSIAPSTTPKTCETYLKQIRGFLQFVALKPNDTIEDVFSENNLGKYLLNMQTKQKNGKTERTSFSYQKTIWSSLNGLCIFLERKRYIQFNPFINIRRPSYQDNIERIELKASDLSKIMKTVEYGAGNEIAKIKQKQWIERDRLIIYLFINTGMRCTALSEINIKDINFEQNELCVIDKRRTEHRYYLSDQLKEYMMEWIEKRNKIIKDDVDPLFISSFHTRLTSREIHNIIKKYSVEALGYPVSPHKFRAAFCTLLYNETHDIEFVKDAVGHKNVATTSRYIVKSENVKKKASDIMGKLI